MKKKYLFLLLALNITGCGTGEYPKQIGSGYIIDYDASSYTSLLIDGNRYVTRGDIVDYKYNDSFIVVKEIPVYEIMDSMRMIKCKKFTYYHYDKAIKYSTKRNYWLIEKKTHIEYGPLERSNFDSLFNVLNIPDTLSLL